VWIRIGPTIENKGDETLQSPSFDHILIGSSKQSWEEGRERKSSPRTTLKAKKRLRRRKTQECQRYAVKV
jgi:hypothetical protein